jgi:small-conductance mechanosensitive channel
MDWLELINTWPAWLRGLLIVASAVLAHFIVRAMRRGWEWLMAPSDIARLEPAAALSRRYPKIATVTSLVVSALTFTIYFVAVGLVFHELNISLTAYLATASVIGLAVAFGSQSLVQDVVIGLTMVFSDAFDIGDVVEVSGQVGRVQRVGLRFTVLTNFHGQQVYVPNRNIGLVSRFRSGCIRAYADIQAPAGVDPAAVSALVEGIALSMRAQYNSIIVADPRVFPIQTAEPGGWNYVRVRFRLWPGQGALIESTFRQRMLAAMRTLDPNFPEWMITVVYRVV